MNLRWAIALVPCLLLRATGPRGAAELKLRPAEESRRRRGRAAAVPSALFRLPCAQWRRRAGRRTRSESGHQLGSPPSPGSGAVRIDQERRERNSDACRSRLPDDQIWELAAFVRSLNAPASAVPVQGDAAAGEAIFFGKEGCSGCHAIMGRGGNLGPDLSNIGATRRLGEIREAILNPKAEATPGIPAGADRSGEGRAAPRSRPARIELVVAGARRERKPAPAPRRRNAESAVSEPVMDARGASVGGRNAEPAGLSLSPHACEEARIENPAGCVAGCSALAAQVSDEDLRKGPNQDWLTYIGDYSARRHSPLTEINPRTISRLAPKWVRQFPGTGDLETVPLVYQGVMYATIPNEVFALDAITGREIWHYRADGAACGRESRRRHSRRPDLLRYRRLPPGRAAPDERRAWSGIGSTRLRVPHYSCTAAPLAVKDKIIVGVAASGQTCFIAALSAETGNEAWRVWTVPRKGEPGSDTWGNFPLENGSAPAWTTGTYDPSLNLLYWPTGNPWPDFGGDRPGDNLYSDCVLALDPDTGKMKWYFQFVPHDTHDWDANEAPVLLDAEFRGRPRKLLVQANRNGFYYILDRTNGEFLLAEPFVKELNWATGIDAKGRPIVAPNTDPSPAGVRVCPTVHGATNWWSPSLNPELGLFYVVALEQCETYYSSAQQPAPNSGFRGTGHTLIAGEKGQFYLRALDVKTGKLRWEFPMPGPTLMWAGTVRRPAEWCSPPMTMAIWSGSTPRPARRFGISRWAAT